MPRRQHGNRRGTDARYADSPRDPGRPGRSRGLRLLRRTLTSTGMIMTLVIVAAIGAVATVDFGTGKPPAGATAGMSTNELMRSLSGYRMDPAMARAEAHARERAHRKQVAAERDARRRAKAEARRKAWEAFKRKMSHDPSVADNKAYAKKMNALKGWSRCWPSLETMWIHESGWNEHAENPGSGAYGIPQALPGSKMASVAPDWRVNAITQITWGLGYVGARYGDPCRAWSFWQAHHWY